jgi:hypothetical protein
MEGVFVHVLLMVCSTSDQMPLGPQDAEPAEIKQSVTMYFSVLYELHFLAQIY